MRINLFLFLLVPFHSQSQHTGTVYKIGTNEKLAYATVGLIKAHIGTSTDEKGRFYLSSSPSVTNDTLVVSCFGFHTRKYPVDASIQDSLKIALEEKAFELKEITISPKNSWSTSTLNDFSNCGNNYVTTTGFSAQVAQQLKSPQPGAYLEKVKICLRESCETVFRLRIYGYDSTNNKPAHDLCNEIIEVNTAKKKVTVDLKQYNIVIPGRQFFVAIEWIKIPANKYISISEIKGITFEQLTYRPHIGIVDKKDEDTKAWELNYDGTWLPIQTPFNDTKMAISATVRY